MTKKVLDHCVCECKHREYILKEDGSNATEFFKGDTFDLNGDAFRNYAGYPRNEIAVINEQESVAVAQAMFERLQVLPDDSKLPENVSDADLKLGLRSRYCQTPSEQIAWTEEMLRVRDERIAAKRDKAAKAAAEQKAKEERDALWNSLTPEEREQIMKKKRDKELDTLV